MRYSKVKLSILMPVRNEGVNIEIMLKILCALVEIPYEVLIVYDHPNDTSIPIVKKLQDKFSNVKLVHNEFGRGVANAVRSGIKESKGKYILIFAVDEIVPVPAIEDMVSLMDEGCDLVSSTRYAYGENVLEDG